MQNEMTLEHFLNSKWFLNTIVGMYIIHIHCLAIEASFYSDVVECLPVDPAAQIRFPHPAVGILLHP